MTRVRPSWSIEIDARPAARTYDPMQERAVRWAAAQAAAVSHLADKPGGAVSRSLVRQIVPGKVLEALKTNGNPFCERVDSLSASERADMERGSAWACYLTGGGDPKHFDYRTYIRNVERGR